MTLPLRSAIKKSKKQKGEGRERTRISATLPAIRSARPSWSPEEGETGETQKAERKERRRRRAEKKKEGERKEQGSKRVAEARRRRKKRTHLRHHFQVGGKLPAAVLHERAKLVLANTHA